MSAAAAQAMNGASSSRAASLPNGTALPVHNHNHGPVQSPQAGQGSSQANVAPSKAKKTKAKKAADPTETGKLLAAKINQLELDAAGEKDQEQEIEREVKKATRDLNNLLSAMGTPIERMEILQKRIADLIGDMKRVERDYIKGKKRADQLQKERDTQRIELHKANSVKEKLEKLARELTKDNKKLKEDIRRLEMKEQNTKDALIERDHDTLEELKSLMERSGSPEKRTPAARLEEMFVHKFSTVYDHYNLREIHFLTIMRAKDTEIQYLLARIENQKKIVDNESTRCRQLTTQVSTFSQTETELRSQLNIYVEKFKQVEDTLNNSNDLFMTFRKEMEEMSKKTKRLERENFNLTRKQEVTSRNILEMADERNRMTKDLEASRKKITTLESIIRHMQEQGRLGKNGGAGPDLDVDQDETESEYEPSSDEEGEYELGAEEIEDDEDDTEEEPGHEQQQQQQHDTGHEPVAAAAAAAAAVQFEKMPPPPLTTKKSALTNGLANGGESPNGNQLSGN